MIWIVVAIAVVLVLGVLGAMALGTRRSKRLREGFGPEYDRVVERHGDQRAAEADLQRAPQSTARARHPPVGTRGA